MDYVVMDLEWNQSPMGRDNQNKDIPFEIIEIGAVKLNCEFKIISEFNEFIKPQIYNEIHFKTQQTINLQYDELLSGDKFINVIERFINWCGDEYIFCTWGASDLVELQRNMQFYNVKYKLTTPLKFYNVQKLFSLCFEEKRVDKSLEYAIDFLDISKEMPFHRALCDAKYTAYVLNKIDISIVEKNYSIDYYNNPKSKEEEINITYDYYSKYISSEYETKEKALSDKEVTSTRCYKCGKKSPKKIKWFSDNSRAYYALSYCKEHGYIRGKIKIRHGNNNNNVFVIKTLRLINEEEATIIRVKQESIREKRRKARNK